MSAIADFTIFRNLIKSKWQTFLNKALAKVGSGKSVDFQEPHLIQTFNLLSFFAKFDQKKEKKEGEIRRKKKKNDNYIVCK